MCLFCIILLQFHFQGGFKTYLNNLRQFLIVKYFNVPQGGGVINNLWKTSFTIVILVILDILCIQNN